MLFNTATFFLHATTIYANIVPLFTSTISRERNLSLSKAEQQVKLHTTISNSIGDLRLTKSDDNQFIKISSLSGEKGSNFERPIESKKSLRNLQIIETKEDKFYDKHPLRKLAQEPNRMVVIGMRRLEDMDIQKEQGIPRIAFRLLHGYHLIIVN